MRSRVCPGSHCAGFSGASSVGLRLNNAQDSLSPDHAEDPMDYRVIIVGAGPAGIFAALTLADLGIDRVLLLEQGKDLDARQRQCSEDMLCGWGGAGAYSDGKLTFSSEVGGYLAEYLDRDSLTGLLHTADQMYVRFGAPDRLF